MTTRRPEAPTRAPPPPGSAPAARPGTCRRDECPMCGGRRLRRRLAPRSWTGEPIFAPLRGALGVSACATCGFEFVNPRPTTALLDAFYGGPGHDFHDPGAGDSGASRGLEVLELIGRGAAGRRLLDFGCGAGSLLRCAARAGWRATGYDPAAPAVEACRRQGLAATSDLASLPPATFDAVVFHHVLEHLPEPRRALRAARGLLAPGGRLFVEVPNVRSLRARLSHPLLARYAGFDERYRAFPIHLSYFDPRTLSRLVAAEGFRVEACTTRGVGLDVLRRRPAPEAPEARPSATAASVAAPAPRSGRLGRAARAVGKPLVRRLLLERGLGESVVVLAGAAG